MTIDRSYARRKKETVPVLYVSTEGTTEKNYFNMLKVRGMGFEMEIFESKRKNAANVVESCFERMSQTDDPKNKGIAVFDVDENTNEDITKAFEKAQEYGIKVAISNPRFETWLLMHFQEIPNEFEKEDVDMRLMRYMPEYSKTADLSELKPKIQYAIKTGYSKFEEYGCRDVQANCPSTNMHCVVKRIMDRDLDW